jgi:serralysin
MIFMKLNSLFFLLLFIFGAAIFGVLSHYLKKPPLQNLAVDTLTLNPQNTSRFEQHEPAYKNTAEKLKASMHLTFEDEFNVFSRYVDEKGNVTCEPGGSGVWQTVYAFCSRTNAPNAEAQVYIDPNFLAHLRGVSSVPEDDPENNFILDNGVLRIRALPASKQITDAVGSWAKYTSGLITTQFSFTQTYGYFEARLKLPTGRGVWPAFWLLPADKSWPPEIDVMESFGETSVRNEGGRRKIHYASHTKIKNDSCGAWHDVGVDITADFHTYGVDVRPDGITYYFDGEPYVTCQPNPAANKPFYLLLNIAIGSDRSWPGAPDRSTNFPVFMDVDYVRAYQR